MLSFLFVYNSQRKEGIFIGILASVNLTKCHWMAVPGYHISGLDILGKGHGHYAIHNFVKEIETGHRSSLFKCLSAQPVQQWGDSGCSGIIIHGPPGCTSLNHFNLTGILLGVGSHIAEAYSSWRRTRVWYVISRIYFCVCVWGGGGGAFFLLFFYISFNKSERPIGVWGNSVHTSVAA